MAVVPSRYENDPTAWHRPLVDCTKNNFVPRADQAAADICQQSRPGEPRTEATPGPAALINAGGVEFISLGAPGGSLLALPLIRAALC